MRTDPPYRNEHVQRFLMRCAGLFRLWCWFLGAALVLAVVGVFPSLIGIIGFLGVAWVPVVLLILWGVLLEDMGFRPPDIGDGP